MKPSKRRAVALGARFDRIFLRPTGFVTLDRLLARLHANKAELLKVLERPAIPLHTNGSESDIRCYVTRRKISAGNTQRDRPGLPRALLSLAKTCDKLGIAIWDYLGSRFKVAGQRSLNRLTITSERDPPRLTGVRANIAVPVIHLIAGTGSARHVRAHTFAPITLVLHLPPARPHAARSATFSRLTGRSVMKLLR